MMRRFAILAICGLSLPSIGFAGTVRVSDPDRAKFQDAMERAAYGDTVLVAPGVYPSIRLRRGIRLISEKGPEETTLRGEQFSVVLAEESDSLNVVEGFTLDGVRACETIVSVTDAPLTLRNCIIKNGTCGVRGDHATMRIEKVRISDCQFGVCMEETKGEIIECDVRRCVTGILLVSSAPRILRSTITGNSVGVSVTEHSDPQIGGSVAAANRIYGNAGGAIRNEAFVKEDGFRTMKEYTLRVPYNYWGSNCPDSSIFRGLVKWTPWVDETTKKSLDRCATVASPKTK